MVNNQVVGYFRYITDMDWSVHEFQPELTLDIFVLQQVVAPKF